MGQFKNKFLKKALSIAVAAATVLTGIPAGTLANTETVYAATATASYDTVGLADSIQEGTILHCWCWSFDTIKDNMKDIAEAGFTTVQTSPANECKDTYTNMKIMGSDTTGGTDGIWWWHYQPTDWKIGNYQLGTRDDFKEMCAEADKYGINVIVDVIPNHTTPDQSEVSQNLINAAGGWDKLYHDNGFNEITQWGNRYHCTTGQMNGLPDVDTENPAFQEYFLNYLNDLITCGADGFRYDTAKHIGVPSDPLDSKSAQYTSYPNFWPVVTGKQSVNGVSLKNADQVFTYGEVLQGDNVPEAEYATYMHQTASAFGGTLRSAVQSKNLNVSTMSNLQHASTDLVTWVESHDTYCNAGESVGLSFTDIRLAWAVIAARKDGTPLFYSRPDGSNSWSNRWGYNVLGAKGNDEFKSTEVKAVNFFRTAMSGQPEVMRNPNGNTQILQIDRGTIGTCIINSGSATTLSGVETSLANGTYTDQVSGRTFTVSGGKLSGSLDGQKVAVIYNPSSYRMNAATEDGNTEFSSDTINVTLTAKNVTNATYTTSEGKSGSFTDGTVITIGSSIAVGGTVTVTLKGTSPEGSVSQSYTFTKVSPNIAYLQLPSGWDAPYAYVYNEAGAQNGTWPGVQMTSLGNGLYSYVVPDRIQDPMVIFYGGDNTRRYPADMEDGLSWTGSYIYDGSAWKQYAGSITVTPTPTATVTPTVTVTPTPTQGDSPIDGSYDVYFTKPSGWGSTVYCYAYVDSTTSNATWPGVQMTSLGNNIYAYNLPDGWTSAYVMFTDNNNQIPGAQEAGLEWTDGSSMHYNNGSWTLVSGDQPSWMDLVTGEYDVYCYKPSGWGSTIYCYAYASETSNNGAWPGVTMTNLGQGVYAYNLPDSWTTAKVIFNDANNQYPASQAPGLDITNGTSMLYANGSWTVVEIPVNNPEVEVSLASGSSFDDETATVTLTLKNATSGTYVLDDGTAKTFTDSVDVVIGKGKIADTDVIIKTTATDGTDTVEQTFTYTKKFNAEKNGGYVVYETTSSTAAVAAVAAVPEATSETAGETTEVVENTAVTYAASSALTGYYGTNPNSGVGSYKTITSASDFTSSMIIAQGVANDDPRIFRGSHEGPVYDTYALYGAWDDTNIYLGWQFVNVTDVVDPAQGYPISDNGKPWNGDIPQMLAFNLKTGQAGSGKLDDGGNVWGLQVDFETPIDALMCFSSKPGVGQPALFKATGGVFSYADAVGFTQAGISFKYEDGFFGDSLYGIKSNGYSGYVPSDLLSSSSNWVDFLNEGHSTAQDTFYIMTIPMSALGITRSQLETNGIEVMHLSTFGQSTTGCLPMDMSQLDCATTAYSADDSTSAEKEDTDVISVPLACLGADGPDPTVTATPTPTATATATPQPGTSTMTVNFGADRSAPQADTTDLTLAADVNGGVAPYTYKFTIDGKTVQNNTTASYTWNTTGGDHKIAVVVTDSEGHTVTVTKDYDVEGEVVPPSDLVINSITPSLVSPQTQGTTVKFTVDAEGGEGTLQYRFYRVINGKTTVFRDYMARNWANANPAVGTYTIYVDVKDEAGNVATKSMSYTWKDATDPLTVNSISASAASPQAIGTTVRFTADAEGGEGTLQYRFYRVIDGTTTVFRDYDTRNYANANPKAGTYTIYVDVKDEAGNVATSKLTYTWEEEAGALKINSITPSVTSPQTQGTTVKFTVDAEGGEGELQYRFYRVFNGTTTVFRSYAAKNYANANPGTAGTYTIYVDVKDEAGNVVTKSLTYTWK